MIHLANSNQISMQSPYQTLAAQPPAQIPNPYPNYTPTPNSNQPNPNPNANQTNRRNNGKRLKRDDDWDICWDYLSPKGCTRDTCRWRHGNPKIDQRQIAKRRKRYMEQNRRGDRNNNHRNNNKRRKRNNNSNIWGHHHPQIMHGPPPPPPYFAAPPGQGHGQQPPPQMPPPQQGQSAQDYYAQYYAAYGYMQPPVPPQQQQQGTVAVAVDPQQKSDEKKDEKKDGALASVSGVAYAQYPGYGYYGGYPYPYGGYPPYGYTPAVAQKGKEDEKKTDDVAVAADTDKAAVGNIEANVKEENDMNTEEIDKFINNDNVAQEVKEKEAEHTVLAATDNGVAIGAVVGDADIDEDIDLNHNENELLSTQPSAGKPAIDDNVLNTDKDEVTCNDLLSETENKDVNIDKNEKLCSPLPSASPPRQCPSDCKCDICAYKQTFQQPQNDNTPTNPPQNPQTIDNKPKRHPMFDGMDYKNNDQDLSSDDAADDNDIDIDAKPTPASNPWSVWHEQYQNYTQPTTNTANPQQILLQAQKNALLAQQQLQKTLLKPKKKKKKKSKKKKGIEHSVKWLYIISDSERECYGSLCRGQFDTITTTKWLTSLYESAEWGADVKDRSRSAQIMDGPAANHIAWYTLSGCNCTLLRDVQSAENANVGFPHWLQQITAAVMKICSCQRNAPNSCEIFYFENKASRWNWHSYCQDAIFGVNGDDGADGGGEGHVGQTIHLLIGHRRQFKFAPRKTKAVPGDEEKCVFLENGDVFVTCGKFTSDYVVKIDCEENVESDSGVLSKAHSSMYIVWRWIAKHNGQCLQKVNF